VVIPARYGSSRFPGKPLARLCGKPMIQHVCERARASDGVARVLVATDDPRIVETVRAFGGEVWMSEQAYRTGTDRVADATRLLPGDVFVNLQGDEIPLDPGLLSDLIRPFLDHGGEMGTLMRPITDPQDLCNPGVVKAVVNAAGEALYFSRAPIPWVRDAPPGTVAEGLHYAHLGVYIYTRATLERLAGLPTSPLEEAEKLEQLRALANGITIRVGTTRHPSLRLDSPADVAQAEAALQRLVAC
jgi:3-deoxy-manno-octulosonate cytidylyltransferase (CMP-KDO synthetase)